MKTIIEPFRIKSVEPLRQTSAEERAGLLAEAGYNLFRLRAVDILIDLLTDSGTSAMSTEQWAAMMRGDESYAGSASYFRLKSAAEDLMGFQHVIPTHQGRAAERILFSVLCKPGCVVPNNTHFDTTRANIEFTGARAVDLIKPEARDTQAQLPFKGDMDTEALERLIVEHGRETDSADHGHGDEQLGRGTARLAWPTSSRCAPSPGGTAFRCTWTPAALRRTPGSSTSARPATRTGRRATSRGRCSRWPTGVRSRPRRTPSPISAACFARTTTDLAQQEKDLLILTEGFPTYGGLAGRDLDAIAVGLVEVLDPYYLGYRIASTAYLGRHIADHGVPIVEPPGGHAIYIDAGRMLPHIPRGEFPAQSLAVELYRHAGIRSVEIGSVMFGAHAQHELLRLAIPRRVYTQSHIDYVVEAILEVNERKEQLRGYEITWQPEFLRHFSCRFQPLG